MQFAGFVEFGGHRQGLSFTLFRVYSLGCVGFGHPGARSCDGVLQEGRVESAPPSRGSTQRLLLCFWKLALLRTGGSSRNPSLYSFRRSASFFFLLCTFCSPQFIQRAFGSQGSGFPRFCSFGASTCGFGLGLEIWGYAPLELGSIAVSVYCSKLLGFRFQVYGVKGPQRQA